MLEKREKNHFLEKLNMIIGLFYTEIGTKMLSEFVKGDDSNIEILVSDTHSADNTEEIAKILCS